MFPLLVPVTLPAIEPVGSSVAKLQNAVIDSRQTGVRIVGAQDLGACSGFRNRERAATRSITIRRQRKLSVAVLLMVSVAGAGAAAFSTNGAVAPPFKLAIETLFPANRRRRSPRCR